MSVVLEAPCNLKFIILEPNKRHLKSSSQLHVMVHYKIHLCVLRDSNKFANQAQQLSVGTAI